VAAVFSDRLLAGKPVTVYGDGTQTRDYVYVADVVEAFVAAADRAEAVGARLNIGTGVETSVLELHAALKRVTSFGPEPELAPARAGELARIALDPSLATRLLGWRPRTSLAEGLARTWEWAFQKARRSARADEPVGGEPPTIQARGLVWHRRARSGRFAVAEHP
jgi:UDP-glucose 4-epimerase